MKSFRTPQSEQSESQFYTLEDYKDFCDDSGYPRTNYENENTFAKAVKNRLPKDINSQTNFYTYYIRTDPNNNILNPIKRHSVDPIIKKNFINRVCKSDTKFTQVTPQIFDHYINFLKTKNVKWLTHAQRELR